jgi:hypothetical protein
VLLASWEFKGGNGEMVRRGKRLEERGKEREGFKFSCC